MSTDELVNKIRRGEIDYNNQSLFFKGLIRALLVELRKDIRVRGNTVPHYILNTGDETMSLEVKGQDHSVEPMDISNEDYIYTIIPRCAVSPKGISLQADDLTSPYANGLSQYDNDGIVITFNSEFRRVPLKMSFDLTYLVDTYTDSLELMQQIITKLSFIRTYSFTYMGQMIPCSYNIPDSFEGESLIDFDEATTDDRRYKISLSIEVETNLPVFDAKTVIPADRYIRTVRVNGGIVVGEHGNLTPALDPDGQPERRSLDLELNAENGEVYEDVTQHKYNIDNE